MVISVPINETVDVIRRLGPLVREDALLMDLTSLKSEPLKAMLEATNASVVATHPLFGPSVHSLQGQRVVVCPGRGDVWLEWVKQTYRSRGLVVVESSAEHHDRVMSIVQVLVHFSTEVMGKTLSRLAVPLEETMEFMSPVYLLELIMTGRHFAQSPELYASIQMANPATPEVTAAFVEAAGEMQKIAVS